MEGGGAMGMGSVASGSKGTDRVSWSIWPMGDEWNSSSHPDDPSAHHHQHLPAIPPAFDSYAATDNHHGILAPIAGSTHGHGHGHGEAHHHLTCLKLGKRQYFEKPLAGGARKERAVGGTSSTAAATTVAAAPRCQVEGCNAGLAEAKEYHKRHKVCEAHSKSPKVVVLGLEQRFCQQCSRFHVLSEFDDAKRSCRRRLAGHNERRRKSSNESMIRNPALDYAVGMGNRFPYIPPSSTSPGCALSLLSSEAPTRWVSPDLSYRSSAALRELIAENRATLLSRQMLLDRESSIANQTYLSYSPCQHQVPILMQGQIPDGWENFRDNNPAAHVTLDLMQVPSSSYDMLSAGRSKSKEDEECCDIWKSLEESHVV